MKKAWCLVMGAALLAASCGSSGNDYSIQVTSPPAAGAVADHSYIIQWTVDVPEYSEAYVNIYADTDVDPSTGLVLLEDSIDVETTGWLWDCSTFPEDQYFIRAVLHHGGDDESDYSDGTIQITHAPLGDVQGIVIVEDSSSGTIVQVGWEQLTGAAAYRVFFSADSTGPWDEIGETPDLFFTHDAPGAGAYGVMGLREAETSPGYGDPASTMPNIFADSVYTIWDDLAPAGSFTAAQLTNCGAVLWGYDATAYQIYCYGAGSASSSRLVSGDAPPLGNGLPGPLCATWSSPSIAPGSGYLDSLTVSAGDLLFCHLEYQDSYARIAIEDVPQNPDVAESRGVSFTYEFQTIPGLRLFTAATP